MPTNAELRYLIDTYLDWTKAENIPVHEGIAFDLNRVETAPWSRLGGGCRGAFVHLRGRGDFVALQIIDIPPGATTDQSRHLFDEIFYVLSGRARVTADVAGNARHFDVGPGALFCLPMNAPFRIANGSAGDPLRIVCANDLPFVMNIFRNESFLFDNDFSFPDASGSERLYRGEGDLLEREPGSHALETAIVADVAALPLPAWEARGAGGGQLNLAFCDSSMHAHISEMPPTSYKKAYWHTPGAHFIAIGGSGYSLMWKPDAADFERHDWHPGAAFAMPEGTFHQHFNTSDEPARYLSLSIGSQRYPVLTRKRNRKQAPTAPFGDGGPQVEYENQDPRIHRIWLQELAAAGRTSGMGQYFDERKITSEMA